MGKTQILMNKTVCSGLSISDLSKTVIYKIWYDYAKPTYGAMQNFVKWIQTASLFIWK